MYFMLLLLLAAYWGASTAAAVTAHHSQDVSGQVSGLQQGLEVNLPARNLLQDKPSAEALQQALQRMMAVPFATRRSVLALGYKGLEADTLRNWHLLARKLATPGSKVTIVTFGASLTVGYIKCPGEDWKNVMEGSWVEPMVAWLKVSSCTLQH
jgi:hypothetical protein